MSCFAILRACLVFPLGAANLAFCPCRHKILLGLKNAKQALKNFFCLKKGLFAFLCSIICLNLVQAQDNHALPLTSQPDPHCSECSRPLPYVAQPFLSLPQVVQVQPAFFPLAGADLLRNAGLEDFRVRSPLGQLLADNFNLFESGNVQTSARGFKEIMDSIDAKEFVQEHLLAELGYHLSNCKDSLKKSDLRKLEKLAVNKKSIGLQRLAHYALARLQEDSNPDTARSWYQDLFKITPPEHILSQTARQSRVLKEDIHEAQ